MRRCVVSAQPTQPAGVDVDHQDQVGEPDPGAEVGHVAHPQLIRPCRVELPPHQILRPVSRAVRDCGALRLAAAYPAQADLAHHQPGPDCPAPSKSKPAPAPTPPPTHLPDDLRHALDAINRANSPAHYLKPTRVHNANVWRRLPLPARWPRYKGVSSGLMALVGPSASTASTTAEAMLS